MDLRHWRWDESSALGVMELDSDHRRFSVLLQDLDDAISTGGRGPNIVSRLRAIALDALVHFDDEDKLFEKYQYPARTQHAKAHDELRQILRTRALHLPGDTDGAAGLLSAEQLRTLLVSHLLYEDLPFCEFLKSRLP